MDDISVGEYIRTKDGIIDKVIIEYNGKCNNSNCRYSDRRTAQDFMCELILNGMVTCEYLVERSK